MWGYGRSECKLMYHCACKVGAWWTYAAYNIEILTIKVMKNAEKYENEVHFGFTTGN